MCLTASAQSAAGGKQPNHEGRPAVADREAKTSGDDEDVQQLSQELDLKPEQRARLRALIGVHVQKTREQIRTAVAKNLDELRRLDQQIQEARLSGNSQKLAAVRTKEAELMGEPQQQAARKKLVTDIAALLTTEQKSQFEQLGATGSLSTPLFAGRLNQQIERLNQEFALNAGQQAQIRKLLRDHVDANRKYMTALLGEHAQEISELNRKIAAAHKTGDEKQVQKLLALRREVNGSDQLDATREKTASEIAAVLTPAQRARFEQTQTQVREMLGLNLPLVREHPEALTKAIASLNLPPEREAKIKAILDGSKAKRLAESKASPADAAVVYKKVMMELKPEDQAMVKAWEPSPPRSQGQGAARSVAGQAK